MRDRHRNRILVQQRSPQRQRRAPAALVFGVLLVIVGSAQAALPPKGARFVFHDHVTPGKNWHVDLRVDPQDPKKLRTLVAYSQQCGETVAKTGIPISDAGVVAASGGLAAGGAWEVNATFTAPTAIVGTMRMRRAGCDTGVLSYPNASTGDGHTEHEHDGGGGHSEHGAKYPNFDKASPKERGQAGALHKRVLRKWRGMTVARAARLGFYRNPHMKVKPGTFHVYNQRYEQDGRIFDARRPESLVFWRGATGQPVILGAMFRAPPGKRPSFAGPIPIYHHHPSKSGKVVSNMTHVWMTSGRMSTWANCLPVKWLALYNPAFKWTPGHSHSHVDKPC